jgi:hypothetical protein
MIDEVMTEPARLFEILGVDKPVFVGKPGARGQSHLTLVKSGGKVN